MFSIIGLRLYFPELEPWVAQTVLLPRRSSQFIHGRMWGHGVCQLLHFPIPPSATSLGSPAAALPRVFSTLLPISTPPTGLDECFFFISLVVGLLYSSIFCQFWLFFVFKMLLSFFWLCKEAQCVYLRLHLGRNSHLSFLEIQISTKILKKFCM